MTLPAISILLLCTCCCTSQTQLKTPAPGLFELLHNPFSNKHVKSKQQAQFAELAPDYTKLTSGEYEIGDLNSDERLPLDIIHSLYESVIFPVSPNPASGNKNEVTKTLRKVSRPARQTNATDEAEIKQFTAQQHSSNTTMFMESSSVPGNNTPQGDKSETTSSIESIIQTSKTPGDGVGTTQKVEIGDRSTTTLRIVGSSITQTNLSTTDVSDAQSSGDQEITTVTPYLTSENMSAPTDGPVPTDERPVPTNETPAPTDETPAPTDEPLAPTDGPPLPTNQTLVSTNKTPVPTDEPPVPTDEPPVPTDEPPVATDEPPVATDEPPVPTDEPPVSTNQTLVSTNKTPVPTDEPPVLTDEPPVATDEPPVATDEPPVPTNEPPVPTNQTLVSTNKTPVPTNETAVPTDETPVPTNEPPVSTNQTLVSTNKTPVPTDKTPVPTDEPPIPTNQTLVLTNKTPVPTNETAVPTDETAVPTNETPVTTDEPPVPTNQTLVSTNKTPVPTDETPAPTEETSAPTEKTPVPTDKTPVPTDETLVPTDETSAPTDETSAPTDEPPVPTNQTPVLTNQTSFSTDQTSISTNKRSISTDQTLVSTDQTSVSTNQTSVSTHRTLISTDQTSISSGLTSVSTDQTSVSTNQTLVPTNQTSIPTNQTSIPIDQTSISTDQTSTSTGLTPLSTDQTSINVTTSARTTRSTSPTTPECEPAAIQNIYALSNDTDIYFNFTTTQLVDDWFVTSDNLKLKLTYDKTNKFCHISGLAKCTEYFIQLTITSCGNSTDTRNETIRTKFGAAPQVLNFQVKTHPKSKMEALWELPQNSNCNSTISYTLSWLEIDGKPEIDEITIQEKNWTFLAENFYKKFKVCIETNVYESPTEFSQSEPWCIITNYSSPGPPSKPAIDIITSSSEVFVEYKLPDPPNGNIDYMEFSLSESEGTIPEEWIKIEDKSGDFFLENLTSCTSYCIRLRAVNIDLDNTELIGKPVQYQFTTEPETLPPPTDLSIADNTSVQFNFTWNNITTNCDHHYKIRVESISNCYTNYTLFTTNQTNLLIQNMTPYTKYRISIRIKTEAGTGEASELIHTTDYSKPPKTNITDPSCDSHKCHFNILVSHLTGPTTYAVYHNGNLKSTIDELESCNSPPPTAYISDLMPYSNYTIKIKASVGNLTEITFLNITTKPSEPGRPETLEVDCNSSPSEGIVKWQRPDLLNGKLEEFWLSLEGFRESKPTHVDTVRIQAHDDVPYLKILDLWPDYSYTFKISAKNQDVKNPGPEEEIHCFKNTSFSPEVRDEKFEESDVIAAKPTAVNIFIPKDLFSDRNGIIRNYSIILYQQKDSRSDSNINTSLFWSDVKKANRILPYRTTPNNWNPFKNQDNSDMCCSKNQTIVQCQIGCNSNCSNIIGPCNGPLKSNTHYQLFIRAYTTAGFDQTKAISFTTAELNAAKDSNASVGVGIAIGITVPILIILVGVLLAMTYRKQEVNKLIFRLRHNRRISSVFATTSTEQIVIENQATTRPVQLDVFFKHYSLMNKDSGLKFSQEFEEIKAISPSFPMAAAHLCENKQKNRWVNILPFDHSRVKILPISDDITTDYINACYIPGFNSQREYIATQGPLPATKDDFWRMVWEQSSQMIVMVTQCVERGKRKCEVYWPEDREVHYYGDLAIQLRSESILSNFTIRIFDLFLGTRTLEVKQMHFTKWPDFGCPENTSLLINFVQAVREHTPHGFIGPFVIHCSAGVGRTGTYISVDRLMQHIQQHNYVDIYGLVLEMRQFRVNMVQTEDQYIYIHSCVRDLLIGKTSTECEPLYANISDGVVNRDSQL